MLKIQFIFAKTAMLKIQFIFSKNIVAYEYNFIVLSYGPIQNQ